MRAAEELFAACGVAGARTREITERAGQGNASALHYHFGSRDGLLQAILAAHRERVEAALVRPPAAAGLAGLVEAYVEAEASELAHDSGRDCLRIVAQLAHTTGVREGRAHEGLRGSAPWGLWELFSDVVELLEGDGLPPEIARERVEVMVMLVGTAFADRARHVDAGRPRPVDGTTYRADLTRMVTAMLTAPGPGLRSADTSL